MRKSLLILLLVTFNHAMACEIQTFDQIYKINKILDDQIISKSTNCNSQIEQVFLDLISNSNGVVSSQILQRYFESEHKQKVTITPSKITIKSLSEFIEENVAESRFSISNVAALHGSSSLTLSKNDTLRAECNTCTSSGRKNLKLMVNNKNLWISADFLHRITALKLKENLSYHTPILTKADFETVEVLEKQPGKFFTDLDNIQYYKVVRSLKSGDLLRVHDLSPKNLITFGQKIKLILKNQTINLKTVGIAQKSGKFGDYIEVKNPKTKKTVMGKIVDFNTAVVEI